MNKDPCETCLRWPECNGVDADNCPLWPGEILAQIVEEKHGQQAAPAYLDEKAESGLIEED